MLHFSITMGNSRNITDSASSLSTPLTTRSIVLSLLLGSHPPVMPVSALVEFCGLFDVAPGTVRTALSRMVDRGELTTDDASYSLSGRLLTRQREQDTGRRRAPAEWDGEWHVVIVTAERRTTTERRDFRARAIGSRLGELRPDIWMRPANIEIPGPPRLPRHARSAHRGRRAVDRRATVGPRADRPPEPPPSNTISIGRRSNSNEMDPAASPPRSTRSPSPYGISAPSRNSRRHSTRRRPATNSAPATTTSSGASATNCRYSSGAERRGGRPQYRRAVSWRR